MNTAFRAIRNQVTLDLGVHTFLASGGFNPTMIRNDGSLTLDGGTLIHLNNLQVGDFVDGAISDSGSLFLKNGAKLTSSNLVVIGANRARGTAVVTGSNTLWTHTGTNYLSVGNQQTNSLGNLVITNQGKVVFTATNAMYVGNGATGHVTIASGGIFDLTGQQGANSYLQVGALSTFAGTGNVTVDGAGSELLLGDRRFFAAFGVGSFGNFTVSNGGKLSGTTTSSSSIGWRGTGTLRIESGGTADVGHLIVGDGSVATGTVTVTGTGSKLTSMVGGPHANTLLVGSTSGSQGFLTVENTGTVMLADNRMTVGNSAGSTGSVLIRNGGILALGHSITNATTRIGESGTGTLTIESGGQASFATLFVGGAAAGIGTTRVSGVGSRMVTGVLSNEVIGAGVPYIGYNGKGTLIVEDSGLVDLMTRYIVAGHSVGSEGTILVRTGGILRADTNSQVNASSIIGSTGTGTLAIESGGRVEFRSLTIANAVGSVGAVTVDGSSSVLKVSAAISDSIIGARGVGTLVVTNGGRADLWNSYVGNYSATPVGQGFVTVTGTGSLFTATSLGIGGRGWGIGGAEVETFGGTGTVRVLNGGRVEQNSTGGRLIVYDESTLHVDGGTVSATYLTFLEGATLSLKLNNFDYLNNPLITSTHTNRIQNAFLVVGLGDNFDGQVEDFFPILRFTNLDATDNRFFGYDEGATVTADGQDFRISYGQDWAGYVTLTMIPEPGTLGLIGAGLGLAALLRRRRR
ncbi:MAG: PEP-CTERM sorting domain-containing protein [Kiritimatiellia bacterium]|nr:PEP-CTERM sorting domain-containing protein [Kiritimatiellia bacterium]